MTNNIATVDLSQATLMDSLSALAGVRSRGVTFYDAKGRPERLSYDELWQQALRFAAGLRKLKMAPGDPLVLILTDPKDAIIAILGSIAAGCPPAPVYPPVSAQAVPAFLQLVGHVAARSRARLVVAAEQVYPFLGTLLRSCPTVQAVRRFGARPRLRAGGTGACRARRSRVPAVHVGIDLGAQRRLGHAPLPRDQSVDDPHSVADGRAVGRRDLAARLSRHGPHRDGAERDHAADRAGGHVAAHLLARSAAVAHSDRQHRGTHTAAPNFAYGLCKKRIADPSGIDLSSMRVFICGAEPIVPETLETFAAHFATDGARADGAGARVRVG